MTYEHCSPGEASAHQPEQTGAPVEDSQQALELRAPLADFSATLATVDTILHEADDPVDDAWLSGKDASSAVMSDEEPRKPGFLRTASDLMAEQRGLEHMPAGTDPYRTLREHHDTVAERHRLLEEKYRRHLAKVGIQDRLGIVLAVEPPAPEPSEKVVDNRPRRTLDQIRQMMVDETHAWIESEGWHHGNEPMQGMTPEGYAASNGLVII